MRFLISALALALALSLGAAVHDPVPAAAAGYRPPPGGHFNVPRSTLDNQRRIERVILAAIRHARKGSVISIAIYSFDRRHMARALIEAHRRGVDVRVLLNDHQYNKAMRMMRDALGSNRSRRSYLHVCDSGCRSYTENLHSKMYLFSHTGRARNVVMTGSVNLTLNATKNQWNDMWVKNDSPALYGAFLRVFREMKRDRPAKPLYLSIPVGDRYRLRVLPYLGARRNDPIMKILDGVRCSGARSKMSNNGRTLVRVSMHAWHTEPRGVYIAEKLRSMYGAGCDVRLLYGMAGQAVKDVLARRTQRGFVPVRSDGFDTNGDGYIDKYSHHKYVVISGNYRGNRKANVMVTGSSNFSNNGLSGDEIIFSAAGPRYAKQWKRNHDFLWNNGSRSVAYSPRGSRVRIMLPDPKPGGPAWEND